jgi:hypothetical protein
VDPSSVVSKVIDLLVTRHQLTPARAFGVLSRAAARKSTTVDLLASRILLGT